MPDIEDMTPGQVLADANVAEFIKTLGLGIAEAQQALDENSVNQIAHFVEPRDSLGGKSLLDLGLSPAFYHYQHADISCSLQISLRIEKDFGFDLNLSGNFGDTSTSAENRSESETESSSGSSSSRTTREARVAVSMTTQGALTVGGNNFQLQGADPMARISALADRLRADSANGIERVLPMETCAPVNPRETPEQPAIVTTPNSVAFLNGQRFHGAFIRIAENPASAETYVLADGHQTQVQPAANLDAYAQAVTAAIRALGYSADLAGEPGRGPIAKFRHRHDEHRYDYPSSYRPEQPPKLRRVADFIKASGVTNTIEGLTDRSGEDEYNVRLGNRRGNYVRDQLLALGVSSGLATLAPSRGEARWAEQNQPNGQRNEEHRLVEIRLPQNYPYLIYVEGDASHPIERDAVAPNQIGDPNGTDNGFVAVIDPIGAALTGRIDIGDQQFELNGAAVDGHAQDSPEAYARNLANAINARTSLGVSASASGNIVHLCGRGSRFELILLTSESRNIEMSGTEDVTVTQQFSRTRSRSVGEQRTGNRTVAVGASLGIRYQKQFEMNVSGNSTITARLVSIPAPPEFLATIKEFLAP